jgi:NitT/TauT family transport system substrate-binding protein
MKDPAAAAETLKKYVPTTDVGVATEELNLMKDYSVVKDVPLGAVDTDRVQKVIDTIVDANQLTKGALKPADVVTVDLAPKG